MAGTPPARPASDLAAVVLTGGGGSRLGGVDKAGLVLGDATLLERALLAVASVAEVVVVGDSRPVGRQVRWAREDPPGGGPAAGLLAGAASTTRPWVVALAVDMPLVTSATVERLWAAAAGDGALLVDDAGNRQPLCAVYRREALLAAAPADAHGTSVRRLVAGLALAEVSAVAGEGRDVDTPEELARLRDLLADGSRDPGS